MFDKLDIIGSGFIQENSKGHYLSRLNNDLMNVMEFVSYRISEIYAQLLSIALVIVLILMTDFKLCLIYLAACLFKVYAFTCVTLNPESIMTAIKSIWAE